jgi:hypothetical protein
MLLLVLLLYAVKLDPPECRNVKLRETGGIYDFVWTGNWSGGEHPIYSTRSQRLSTTLFLLFDVQSGSWAVKFDMSPEAQSYYSALALISDSWNVFSHDHWVSGGSHVYTTCADALDSEYVYNRGPGIHLDWESTVQERRDSGKLKAKLLQTYTFTDDGTQLMPMSMPLTRMNLSGVRTSWINLDQESAKASQMLELLNRLGFNQHQRFPAVTHFSKENAHVGQAHYKNCAESHFQILKSTILTDGKPILILEDDVELAQRHYQPEISFPADADAVYLGTSHGDGNYNATVVSKQGDESTAVLRIAGMYGTHAVLYLTRAFAQAVVNVGRQWVHQRCCPFDVGVAFEVRF